MQLNEVDINSVTKIKAPTTQPTPKNSNPLFTNPGNAPKGNPNGDGRKKIRV
jgi:hypothetical protein